MTPAEAQDLAERILARIAFNERLWPADLPPNPYHAADRERVASDLAGLHAHRQIETLGEPWCDVDGHSGSTCDDARRYADGLRRTARTNGVEVS